MIRDVERSLATRGSDSNLFLQRWGAHLSDSQRRQVRAAMRQDSRAFRWLPPALLGVGLVLWGLGGSAAGDQVSDLGLIDALPLLWWVGVGLVGLAFIAEVSNASVRVPMLAMCVVGLVVVLHSTPLWMEEEPRFVTAWLHVGFSDYIGETGTTLPQLDARMSWPGFFSATGMLARAMGVDDRWFLPLATVGFNLAYLIPLKALANSQLRSERARWTTLWIFVAANWVGQDYFAPQALNFFLMITVFAIVGSVFAGGAATTNPSLGRRARSSAPFSLLARLTGWAIAAPSWARPAEMESRASGEGARLAWLGIVCLIFASMVVSHQLTPIAVVACLVVLVLFDRTVARGLPLIFGVLTVAWLSWGAVDYWQGHLDSIFGGFGRLGDAFDQNVQGRLTGSADRLLVLRSRIALGAGVWVAAMIGLALRWRRGYQHLAMASLLVAPFGVVAAQSYGGEAVLRVFLYTLPAASVLVAAAIAERPGVGRRNDIAARLAPVAVVLLALFPLVRWGNERFERVTTAEIEAMEWVSSNVPHGSTLISLNYDLPWRYRDLAAYEYQEGQDSPDDWMAYLNGKTADPHTRSWVILTRGQNNFGEMEAGYPPGWIFRLANEMTASGRYELVFENDDAAVLCVVGSSCGTLAEVPDGS